MEPAHLSEIAIRSDHYVSSSRSYSNLTPRTRLYLGAGLLVWSALGLWVTDKAERTFGLEPTEKDKEELTRYLPKITVVDRVKQTKE